jgi:molybdopterin/thiamine biosynthesis adenylyltransferase
LRALNPEVVLNELCFRLTPDNAPEVLGGYDAVVEATDSYAAKLMINDACVAAGLPLATAGVQGLNGHAMLVIPDRTACLRCLLPCVPENAPLPADEGVLGAAAGMMGALMAVELLTWLAGIHAPPDDGFGVLHGFDGREMRQTTLRVPRRADCECNASTGNQEL